MGTEVEEQEFSREDRTRYREKVKRCLAVLSQMIDEGRFETNRKLMGVEAEFYVVDEATSQPCSVNAELLDRIESEDFQTELAQFNIEFNLQPHKLVGRVFSEIEEELLTSFTFATTRAHDMDADVVMIGILPTLAEQDATLDNISANPRYKLLNDQILAARGEQVAIHIEGDEKLVTMINSIMLEAAATSVQLHLQVSPEGFPRTWNAAQAIAGAQIAMAANSPFLFGKDLWRETRIAVFQQSIDTRTEEIAAQGVRPRVWFGEKWVEDPMDLWEENVAYFPSLLPLVEDEDPALVLASGGLPRLAEMKLHNGTIYRWNRPVYDVARGKPHLRVENRVLPDGPTVTDVVANAAFWFGLVRAVADLDEPISDQMTFEQATENFYAAARDGMEAELFWPGVGSLPASELVVRHLLPLARQGLRSWKINGDDKDRLLGIIEQRCQRRRTGASWQRDTFRHLIEDHEMERDEALAEMTRRYRGLMHTNMPVHEWPEPADHTEPIRMLDGGAKQAVADERAGQVARA